jgi:HEAT repeat protein
LGSDSAARRQRAALTPGEVPVAALVEAALREEDPNVAGALRWAIAREGDSGLKALADGLDSSVAAVRKRAVQGVAELPSTAATDVLRVALEHDDAVVRRYAALALAGRGVADAVPLLVALAIDDDADAGDALGALAGDPGNADRIVAGLVAGLGHGGADGRRRLARALADVPGRAASRALEGLAHDEDGPVAGTARYALELRR